MCGRPQFGKGFHDGDAGWSGAAMCSACLRDTTTAGPNAIRESGRLRLRPGVQRALGCQDQAELAWAAAECRRSGRPARRFTEFFYTTRTGWRRRRRVVGKAEQLDKGADPRFIVTSLRPSEIDGRVLYERLYCARGEMENRIKEQQLDLFADLPSPKRSVGFA